MAQPEKASILLPKLHTRVRFPSPAPKLSRQFSAYAERGWLGRRQLGKLRKNSIIAAFTSFGRSCWVQ